MFGFPAVPLLSFLQPLAALHNLALPAGLVIALLLLIEVILEPADLLSRVFFAFVAIALGSLVALTGVYAYLAFLALGARYTYSKLASWVKG